MTKLTIYGARGSSPFDSIENAEFGGNTSCYVLRSQNTALILDAGTGILAAEQEILGNKPKQVFLAISHSHHDHIEGLGLTAIAYIPSMKIRVIADTGTFAGLEQRFNSSNFPAPYNALKGIDHANPIVAKDRSHVTLDDFVIDAYSGNHPGGVLGFRIKAEDKIVVYATDFEFDYERKSEILPASQDYKSSYLEMISGADILIADACYTRLEYETQKPIDVRGFGHSYAEQIAELAARAGVKQVIMTHHNVRRTDRELRGLEEAAQAFAASRGYSIKVSYARQGEQFELGGG